MGGKSSAKCCPFDQQQCRKGPRCRRDLYPIIELVKCDLLGSGITSPAVGVHAELPWLSLCQQQFERKLGYSILTQTHPVSPPFCTRNVPGDANVLFPTIGQQTIYKRRFACTTTKNSVSHWKSMRKHRYPRQGKEGKHV